jgi:hypothetical protein
MKRILALCFAFLPLLAGAQSLNPTLDAGNLTSVVERVMQKRDSAMYENGQFRRINSRINLELASSVNSYFTEGNFDELSFKMDRVRWEMYGRLHKNLSYHFRQSFNKDSNPNSLDKMSSSVEYAYVKWHHNSGKFDLSIGKQYLSTAGYENWVNGLLVREFTDFNDNINIYRAGLMGLWRINPNNNLMLQVVNNRNSSDSQWYQYGLPDGVEPTKVPLFTSLHWNGWFADKSVHLMYSASAARLAKGKNAYHFMCGNVYEKGPVLAYLDVLYSRSAIDAQQRITVLQNPQNQILGFPNSTAQNTQYLTFIANVDYQFHPKWNAYVKGAYETCAVYADNGIFSKGRYLTSWNAQACLEWFPITQDKGFKVFAHYVYKGHILSDLAKSLGASMPHTQRISLGIQYIIPVL